MRCGSFCPVSVSSAVRLQPRATAPLPQSRVAHGTLTDAPIVLDRVNMQQDLTGSLRAGCHGQSASASKLAINSPAPLGPPVPDEPHGPGPTDPPPQHWTWSERRLNTDTRIKRGSSAFPDEDWRCERVREEDHAK